MTSDPDEDLGPFASPPCFLHELDPADSGPPAAPSRAARLLPARAFPPYAYLPGRFPHPVRDPRGHSHGPPGAAGAARDPDAMAWGMDLFNHGYYWEAHEAWEDLWRAAAKATPDRDLLHGLILLAAAGVKLREAKPAAARRHGLRAASLLRAAAGAAAFRLGLPVDAIAAAAERAVLSPAGGTGASIVFDIALGAPPPARSEPAG